jgi:hypothetical protein
MTSTSTSALDTSESNHGSSRRATAAEAAVAAAREFSKSLVTLAASILGVYGTLLSWIVPRYAAGARDPFDVTTALCLIMPIMDLMLAITAYGFAFFGAGFEGEFAPNTYDTLKQFHRVQLAWLRSGSIFLALGLVAAFAILGRLLLVLNSTAVICLEGVAAACTGAAALATVARVGGATHKFVAAVTTMVIAVTAAGLIAGPKGVLIGGLLVGGVVLAVIVAAAWAFIYAIVHAKS